MIEGIRLRPVEDTDLDALDECFASPAGIGEFNWNGFTNPTTWRRLHKENGLLADAKSVLMVELAGATLGFVSWQRTQTGNTSHCIEFGITLWQGERGKGHGTAAQLLLARYLFARSPINRIQAYTEFGNLAEQRALEKAGFVREAVLKGYSFRDGEWRDEVVYRMLRAELPTVPPPRD